MRAILLFTCLAAASPAMAGNSSAYTDFDLKTCLRLTPETSGEDGESSGTFECKGFGAHVVTFAEGDLRSLVAFGTETADHCAFRQTFGGFNSVGNKIEWRLKGGKPIATILRWSVSYDPSKQKTWLVVTKLEADDSCHMGYVEGAYPNANAVAQTLADSFAESFSCAGSRPIFVAKVGTETDGIAANGGCMK